MKKYIFGMVLICFFSSAIFAPAVKTLFVRAIVHYPGIPMQPKYVEGRIDLAPGQNIETAVRKEFGIINSATVEMKEIRNYDEGS